MARKHDFVCPVADCGFTSTDWPTEHLAQARGLEHLEEHRSGVPMRELDAFRKAHRYIPQAPR